MPHPNDRRARISRRDFLRRAAVAGVAMPSAAAILAACGGGAQQRVSSGNDNSGSGNASQFGTGGISGAPYPLARPDAAVTWKIQPDNQPIESNMQPEKN